ASRGPWPSPPPAARRRAGRRLVAAAYAAAAVRRPVRRGRRCAASRPGSPREPSGLLDGGDAGVLEPATAPDSATPSRRIASGWAVRRWDGGVVGRIVRLVGGDQVSPVEGDVPGLRVVGHRVVAGLGLPVP